MFIELVSALRCVAPHEDTWLVAASDAMVGRHLREGVLGCPVCRAEYPVREGVAHFGRVEWDANAAAPEPSADEVIRLAALLGAGDAGLFVLCGAWCAHAASLAATVPADWLVVDGTAPATASERLSVLRSGPELPLAIGAARGVALDDATLSARRIASAVRVLAPGGRLVAPASTAIPPGVVELARDDRHWVAERQREATVTAPIALRRG